MLLSMQQKLDNLCEQVNYFKDQPGTWEDMSFSNNVDFLFNEPIASEKVKTVACGHRLSDQHQANDQMVRMSLDHVAFIQFTFAVIAEI